MIDHLVLLVVMAALRIEVAPGDWGDAGAADIQAVALSAGTEIWKHCDGAQLAPIILQHRTQSPITLFDHDARGRIVVGLATENRHWAQLAFQFGHEFCHVLADHANDPGKTWHDLDHANKWFEETLSETASLFVLRRMSETWKIQPPYPNWKSYAPALQKYAADRMAEPPRQLPPAQDFRGWFAEHEPALRKKSTQRDLNCIVAAQLLPVFERSPQGWGSIAYLNLGTRDPQKTFRQHLVEWRANCPAEMRKFVGELAAVFGINL